MLETLARREAFREDYRRRRDPIASHRLRWRAQTFRHLAHLLPGQRILELGCGDGSFTRQLDRVARGECPITAVTFDAKAARPANLPASVSFVPLEGFPGELEARAFDLVVAMDLLDRGNCSWLLGRIHDLLRPGGQVVFYESNPWNPVLKARRLLGRLIGRRDPRRLMRRTELYELLSAIGYIRVFAVFNDFVYRPLPRKLIWAARNASILLENAPLVRRLAGSILLSAQKPPRAARPQVISLAIHACLRGAVSVVVPCRNEEMNVTPLVERLLELYGDYIHEIIPVDDSSTDGTRQALEALAARDPRIRPVFRSPPNGVGRALADGYRQARGSWILSMDCDFQHLLPDMRDLFDAAAEGCDVAVGSRFSRHSVLLNYPFLKILANRGFHVIANIVLLRRFRDLTNNLKLLRHEVLESLVLTQPGFSVNAETGLQPLWMGYKVSEVPISWINRSPEMGTSSFKLLRVGGGYWTVLWRLWLRSAFGAGPYRALERVGPHRRTLREPGKAPASR